MFTKLRTPRPAHPRVGLFVTCLTDQFYPRVGVAITRILEKLGCVVAFPKNQTCCGQPFYNSGQPERAADLAQRMLGLFEGYDFVVTPSASCCAMVRGHFPQILAGRSAERARALAEKTFEFVEFLDQVLRADLSAYAMPSPRRLTYHYTCHLRGLGVTDEPLKLLKRIKNIEVLPMDKTDQCCGFGGTFAIKYPAISASIVEDKVRCIEATGAEAVVCNEAGCTMNIAGMCHRSGVKTDVVHFAELLAEAMNLSLVPF